jgi:hypothetical protein
VLAFYFGQGLSGLWFGTIFGEVLLGAATSYYIWSHSDWEVIALHANERNESEMIQLQLVPDNESRAEWVEIPS